MAGVFRWLIAAAAVLVAVMAVGVSAQTHHVVGGDATSSPSGRAFTVSDKLWVKHSGAEEEGGGVVDVASAAELESCDVANPIRMYTDHVPLDRPGLRHFTSGNPRNCRNGLKLPVSVLPPPFEPYPFHPPPQSETPPPFDPPFFPPHLFGPPPQPQPHQPPPVFRPPPPPPSPPPPPPPLSAANRVIGTGLVILACCLYIILAI